MSQNDLIAAAAHLHVALRRKTGRIIDTEWLACNDEYARAMVDYARSKAEEEGHDDLMALADRLDTQIRQLRPRDPAPEAPVPISAVVQAKEFLNSRYIGRLR